MAMLTVTLVASLAAAGLWQQWRAAETEKHPSMPGKMPKPRLN